MALRRTILLGAFASAAILTARAATTAYVLPRRDMAPDALVQSVLTEVIESIKADPSLRRGDFDKLQGLIDDKVAPHVDFERMTRLSIGPGWRRATPEQRQALIREFRGYALHTYSGALSRVTDEKVKVWPVKRQPGETDVMVHTEVVPSKWRSNPDRLPPREHRRRMEGLRRDDPRCVAGRELPELLLECPKAERSRRSDQRAGRSQQGTCHWEHALRMHRPRLRPS